MEKSLKKHTNDYLVLELIPDFFLNKTTRISSFIQRSKRMRKRGGEEEERERGMLGTDKHGGGEEEGRTEEWRVGRRGEREGKGGE